MRKEIARLHEKIDGLNNTVSEYRKTIAENERMIVERDVMVAERDRMIADLKMANSTGSHAVCQNCGSFSLVCQTCNTVVGEEKEDSIGHTSKPKVVIVDGSNDTLKIRPYDRLHDGPNTPTSHNTVGGMITKRKMRKDPKDYRKPGRKPGHEGVSSTRKIDGTRTHPAPDLCDCGGNNKILKTCHKQVTDIPFIPTFETIDHVWDRYVCTSCGREGSTEDEIPSIPGTSFGSNILVVIAMLYMEPSSYGSIGRLCSIFDDVFNKHTIISAFAAIAQKVKPCADEFREGMKDATWMNMDETPISTGRKRGYIWLAHANTPAGEIVSVRAATTRSASVLDEHFSHFDKPIVCDGYGGYTRFVTRQRCWSHELREFTNAIRLCSPEKRPQLQAISDKLHLLYHDADSIQQRPPPSDVMEGLKSRLSAIIEVTKDVDGRLADRLKRAEPHMFVFLEHPGMEPTNNRAERDLRPIVISKKIRQTLRTKDGREAFSDIMTCMKTWSARGQDVKSELLQLFGGRLTGRQLNRISTCGPLTTSYRLPPPQ